VGAEDDVYAVPLVLGPAREPFLDSPGERVTRPGMVVVAPHVRELHLPAVELEPVRDLLLVAGDGHGAELGREHGPTACVTSLVLEHLADDLLDPRRPVAHPEVAPEAVPELGGERVDLRPRRLEEGERPPIAR
jgi:hypothetical protein